MPRDIPQEDLPRYEYSTPVHVVPSAYIPRASSRASVDHDSTNAYVPAAVGTNDHPVSPSHLPVRRTASQPPKLHLLSLLSYVPDESPVLHWNLAASSAPRLRDRSLAAEELCLYTSYPALASASIVMDGIPGMFIEVRRSRNTPLLSGKSLNPQTVTLRCLFEAVAAHMHKPVALASWKQNSPARKYAAICSMARRTRTRCALPPSADVHPDQLDRYMFQLTDTAQREMLYMDLLGEDVMFLGLECRSVQPDCWTLKTYPGRER